MPVTLRLATFNIENLDDKPGQRPTLEERRALILPQLARINADVLCLEEVNGQDVGGVLQLAALDAFLIGTPYADFHRATTTADNGAHVRDRQNIVILSRFAIEEFKQFRNDLAPAPSYRLQTADPPSPAAQQITWERPILYAKLDLGGNKRLHVISVHLKSRIPTDIAGQKVDQFTWKTASGWAEGSFLSALKRAGQAVETRLLIDRLFDDDEDAAIVACGDFNSDADDVPVLAIRGDVGEHNNPRLAKRTLVVCERTIPEPSRFSLIHRGKGVMLDHILISRALLPAYRGTEVHNETLHDESVAFATDVLYPESDHAPVVVHLELPDA